MELRERPYGTTVVVDVKGPVDRESGATTQFAVSLKRLVQSGRYRVLVVNVQALHEIDSVLLGAITQAHTSATRAGVTMKLLNVTPRLRELLVLTKLDRFIEVAESEQAELGDRRIPNP